MGLLDTLLGNTSASRLKKLQPYIRRINEIEPQYKAMSDEQLRGQTALFRERLKNGETLDNSGYNMFVVGTNYALSKRTNAYLSYGQVKYDRAIDVAGTERESTVGLGISHSF